ncbi:bifunctional lysylphosphatidylglycerol flippase/synthetase MprF [Cohnella nanjingensis]|uniref:Phosphatidylglycerol lysyltransferase n=1 Tax=Cohnella nanjingensis TaxID=1387779 RepID=A0A7X0RSB8_9BACL|nr:bifunctional lysylphosphatidylglycerol flippase/synthetase MprF [Cohnella nanjingensis]MBB6672783.1 bifunctional lysylphosphatidylglycerol flippase/synthetase MprF [Cohnella nanjingensis]
MNAPLSAWFERGKRYLKILLPVLILVFLYSQTHAFLRDIRPSVALHIMGRIHLGGHLLLLGVSLFAVSIMIGYDLLLLRWNGARLPLRTVWKISWISNSFNNALGFAGFTGAGLRLMLYRKRGVSGQGLLGSVLYLSLSGLTGLSVLCLLLLGGAWKDHALLQDHSWLLIAIIGVSVYLPVFALLKVLPLLKRAVGVEGGSNARWTPAVAAIAASFAEWIAAALTFWVAARMLHLPMDFRDAAGIYTMAAVAGIASFVPGGLGSFDVVALLGLNAFGIPPARALALVLVFRMFYYFIPLSIGLALASTEWLPGKEAWSNASGQVLKPAVRRWQAIWNWPSQMAILRDFGGWALAALVFLSGALLLLSAATPGQWHRMHLLEHYITPLTMKGSHQLTVLIGLLMLVLSEGIRLQVKRAYYATLVLLLAGAVFSILKGFDYEESLFLAFVFVLLWLSKDRFRREEAPFSARKIAGWAFVTLAVTYLYLSVGRLTNDLPERFVRSKLYARYMLQDQDFLHEAVLALAITWILLTARWLLRPRLPVSPLPDSRAFARLKAFLQTHRGNFLTHLLFLGDKSFLWTADGRAMLAYGATRKTLVALGDPIGEPAAIRDAIRTFREYADRYASTAAFYQVKAEYLPIYHEFGYRFFKLGEEAVVNLAQFGLTGRSKADLRAACNRFEREGYRFEMIEAPFPQLFLLELREVSDEWLGDRAEKGFSLGTFRESYLELAPIAVLKDQEGRTAAFASLMPVYDGGKSVSVDLMRYRKGLRSGVMDVLFVHLLQWAKASGYERFNLGMAPLASVGESEYSYRGERIARLIFLKGNHFYSFQGLRRFKEKFDPVWEPRYLAYPKNAPLAKIMYGVTRIVSRSLPRNGK